MLSFNNIDSLQGVIVSFIDTAILSWLKYLSMAWRVSSSVREITDSSSII